MYNDDFNTPMDVGGGDSVLTQVPQNYGEVAAIMMTVHKGHRKSRGGALGSTILQRRRRARRAKTVWEQDIHSGGSGL